MERHEVTFPVVLSFHEFDVYLVARLSEAATKKSVTIKMANLEKGSDEHSHDFLDYR